MPRPDFAMSPDPCDPDRELVRRCLAGESGAWERLVRERGPQLERAVRQVLRRSGVADEAGLVADLLQDTYVSLLQDQGAVLRAFRWDCSFGHYLISIAIHRSTRWLRSRRESLSLDREGAAETLWKDLVAAGQPEPSLALEESERNKRLRQALRQLPARERLALYLFYWRSAPANAIARLLGVQPDSVWPYLVKGRHRLGRILREHFFML